MEFITYAIIFKWKWPCNATNVLARILHPTNWVCSFAATTLSTPPTWIGSSTGLAAVSAISWTQCIFASWVSKHAGLSFFTAT
jgi:hypothetical protein